MKARSPANNVTVIGMARSGVAAAGLLNKRKIKVRVIDSNISDALVENQKALKKAGIEAKLNVKQDLKLAKSDLIVLSPGVRLDALILKPAVNVPVISELELAFRFCPCPVIGVTGTNGKTTVTTLIGEALKASGRDVKVCGNIGISFSAVVDSLTKDSYAVVEVSSFQLEAIEAFKPFVSVFLNFTPDHLDRYADLNGYLEAKKRIFLNQTAQDYAVLNYCDNTLRDLSAGLAAKVVFFNKPDDDQSLDPNKQAVMKVAAILGLDIKAVKRMLDSFKGIEHRMEFVREVRGRKFINDSKATNIDSTEWALERLKEPTILIAGGRDKNADFQKIKALLKSKVKAVVAIGESREKIYKAFSDSVTVEKAQDLREAIDLSFRLSQPGDLVILSPMCASFDMFKDYEHRGSSFKNLVNQIKSQD